MGKVKEKVFIQIAEIEIEVLFQSDKLDRLDPTKTKNIR